MPTANYFIHPEDSWVQVVPDGATFARISCVPHSATFYLTSSETAPPTEELPQVLSFLFTNTLVEGDTITIDNGEVYTFTATPADPFDVELGVSAAVTSENFLAAVNTDSTYWTATQHAADEIYLASEIGLTYVAAVSSNPDVTVADVEEPVLLTQGMLVTCGYFQTEVVNANEAYYVKVINARPDKDLRIDVLHY